MEIVLDKNDIEKILKEKYKNIREVKFSGKNPKITLLTDSFEQIEPQPVTKHDIKTTTVESPPREEPPQTKKPKGNVMGTERRIIEL